MILSVFKDTCANWNYTVHAFMRACICTCVRVRSRNHLSKNSPTSGHHFLTPHLCLKGELYLHKSTSSKQQLCLFLIFFLFLTSSPCFPWYWAPWNLHNFQIKCEWRVYFLRIAWHDGWNPTVNMILEPTASVTVCTLGLHTTFCQKHIHSQSLQKMSVHLSVLTFLMQMEDDWNKYISAATC